MMKKILFFLLKGKEVLFALFSVYVLLSLILSVIGPNQRIEKTSNYTVYVSGNGIHTDFLLPIKNPLFNWKKTLNLEEELKVDTFQTHLKFGWGNRTFFLNTKEWSDLTFGTAVQSVFGNSEGAMHLVLCTPKDLNPNELIKLQLSEKQYIDLCVYLRNSFEKQSNQFAKIKNHPYGTYDFFFESTYNYNMFFTCNSWTNEGLKAAQQNACIWTPFRAGIEGRLK